MFFYCIRYNVLIKLVYTPSLWHILRWQMNNQDPRQVWSSYASPHHASLFPRVALELLSLCWFHPAPKDQLEIPLWNNWNSKMFSIVFKKKQILNLIMELIIIMKMQAYLCMHLRLVCIVEQVPSHRSEEVFGKLRWRPLGRCQCLGSLSDGRWLPTFFQNGN